VVLQTLGAGPDECGGAQISIHLVEGQLIKEWL
jgi:hypothetical protein